MSRFSPVYQIRLLLISVGIVFGELMQGYQRALVLAAAKVRK